MAKRHESLISLSHDHHHGLALAMRLQQGDSALLTDGWTHDRVEQAKRVQRFYREDLKPHFAAEEQALFPAMKQEIPGSILLIDDLISQHRALEQAVAGLPSLTPGDVGRELVALGEKLERHIRIEERELFPLFEKAISTVRAAEIGDAIAQVEERVAAEGRSVAHVREEVLCNARTETIYALLEDVPGYPRWWEDVAGGHEPSEHKERMVLWLGGERFDYRDVEYQKPRLVRVRISGDRYAGELVLSLEDAPGGRRVRMEVNLDPVLRSSGEPQSERRLERRLSDSVRAALRGLERSIGAH